LTFLTASCKIAEICSALNENSFFNDILEKNKSKTCLVDASSLENLDTSEYTDLSYMFCGCSKINDFNFVKKWDKKGRVKGTAGERGKNKEINLSGKREIAKRKNIRHKSQEKTNKLFWTVAARTFWVGCKARCITLRAKSTSSGASSSSGGAAGEPVAPLREREWW